MTNTKINVNVCITVGALHGRSLEMTVYDGDRVVHRHLDTDIHDVRLKLNCSLPSEILFKISGKAADDTLIDDNGTILADKFLRVDALCINGIWVKKWTLESSIFQFQGDRGECHRSNYWGLNGQSRLSLPQDLLEFWLDMLTLDQ